jgi:hypothetical protein
MSEGPSPAPSTAPSSSTSTLVPAGRRVALLGVLLILLALAVLIWQAREAGIDDEPPPPAERSSIAPASGRPSLVDMLSGVREPVPQAAGTQAGEASTPERPRDRLEVCGLGSLKLDAAGEIEQAERLEGPLREARKRLLVALANSPDEGERAAGLYMQSFGSPPATFSSKEDPGTPEPDVEAGLPKPGAAAALARDALATLASHSRSAQVYALALNACARSPGEGACSLVSNAQWARLDPRNAAPWLQIAGDAGNRGDTAGLSEALFNVAHASVNDSRALSVLPMVMARVPADAMPFVRSALGGELLGFIFSGLPPYAAISNHCAKPALADANRQQACLAVAEVLTTRDGNLLDLVVGTAIGERSGWPAERVQALRDERDAIAEVSAKAMPQLPDLLGCDAQQRFGRYLAEVGAYGELGALRRALKQSPDGVAVLAKRNRERRALATAAAAASQP